MLLLNLNPFACIETGGFNNEGRIQKSRDFVGRGEKCSLLR